MAHITENDYKKLADAVADDLITQKIALNTSVQKLANAMQMSQEQIRRLCESANNATFGKMFQSKDKTAADRIVEFDVADADVVLGHSIKEANFSQRPRYFPDLSEFRSLDADDDVITKVASDKSDDEDTFIPPVRREVDGRTIKKTLDHLRHEKFAAEMAYHDSINSLRNRFRRVYQDCPFETFEKNAAAIHGSSSLLPLTDLRKELRLPAVSYDYGQLTKVAGYIDDSGLEYQLFSEAVKQHTRLATVTAGIKRLETVR